MRNLLVTSGTLSPLKATRDALGVRFVTELANKHVVEQHQVQRHGSIERSRIWIKSRGRKVPSGGPMIELLFGSTLLCFVAFPWFLMEILELWSAISMPRMRSRRGW